MAGRGKEKEKSPCRLCEEKKEGGVYNCKEQLQGKFAFPISEIDKLFLRYILLKR